MRTPGMMLQNRVSDSFRPHTVYTDVGDWQSCQKVRLNSKFQSWAGSEAVAALARIAAAGTSLQASSSLTELCQGSKHEYMCLGSYNMGCLQWPSGISSQVLDV